MLYVWAVYWLAQSSLLHASQPETACLYFWNVNVGFVCEYDWKETNVLQSW